jgi:hypothetical protein
MGMFANHPLNVRALAHCDLLVHCLAMDVLTAFGLFAVTAMVVCYALERRHPFLTLLFAFSSLLGSVYGFLQKVLGRSD